MLGISKNQVYVDLEILNASIEKQSSSGLPVLKTIPRTVSYVLVPRTMGPNLVVAFKHYHKVNVKLPGEKDGCTLETIPSWKIWE